MLYIVCDILVLFEEATMLVQGQNQVRGRCVVPLVQGLKKSQLPELKLLFICKMVNELERSVEKHLSPYLSRGIHFVFQLATALDPRFELGWYANVSGKH